MIHQSMLFIYGHFSSLFIKLKKSIYKVSVPTITDNDTNGIEEKILSQPQFLFFQKDNGATDGRVLKYSLQL